MAKRPFLNWAILSARLDAIDAWESKQAFGLDRVVLARDHEFAQIRRESLVELALSQNSEGRYDVDVPRRNEAVAKIEARIKKAQEVRMAQQDLRRKARLERARQNAQKKSDEEAA